MKIERHYVEESTIELFAEEQGLVMEVHERGQDILKWRHLDRFYAIFKKVEEKDGSVLRGIYGNGDTPEEAITNYANRLSEKWIVFDAMGPTRRELKTPRFVDNETTPKQQCGEDCPYREDALKWRKQQEAKKSYMRKRRKK